MTPQGAKAKERTCARCKKNHTPVEPSHRICQNCRKKCSSCGILLTKENWDTRGFLNRKQFRCKGCVAEGVRKSPGRETWQRNYDLKRHYGITLDEAEELKKNGCQICGSMERLVIDHCHKSDNVRGCLCGACNTALGMFKDNKENLRKAIDYLS